MSLLNKNVAIHLGLILLALIIRFLANKFDLGYASMISPIGALLLMVASKNKSKYYLFFVVTLLGLLLSDMMINALVYKGEYGFFADGWWVTYLLFAFIIIVGQRLSAYKSFLRMGLSAIVVSVIFWLVSDAVYLYTFGIEITTGAPLPINMSGYAIALKQGLPFARNFLAGTFIYSMIFYAVQIALTHKTTQTQLELN